MGVALLVAGLAVICWASFNRFADDAAAEDEGSDDKADETPDKDTDTTEDKDEGAEDDSDADDKDTGDDKDSAGGDADEEEGDGLSADLLRQAQEAGFSEDEAKACGSAANLEKMLVSMDARTAEMGRSIQKTQEKSGDEDEDEGEPQRRKPAKTSRAKARRDTEEEPEFDPGIDVEEYPTIVKAIKKLEQQQVARLAERDQDLAELREQFKDASEHFEREQKMALFARLERAFEDLPDEWDTLFGDKNVRENSPEWDNRMKVLDTMDAMAQAFSKSGKRIPGESAFLLRAARVEFSEHAKAMTRRELTGKAQKRSSQITSRPTHRKRAPLTGRQKAVKRAEKYAQDVDAS